MRILIICVFTGLTLPVLSQSKKELQAEVDQLRARISQLIAEVTELKKPIEVDLTDSTEQVSYCFGVVLGQNFKNTGLDSLDMEVFLSAMHDVFEKKPLNVSRQS